MNFLTNLKVSIKTLNELLLIHLIEPDHIKYKYFSMYGYDRMEIVCLGSKEQVKLYVTNRYEMIDGDEEFNSIQKERIETLISSYSGFNGGSFTSGGMCNVYIPMGSAIIGGQSAITGGYTTIGTSTITQTKVPVK